jgi:hypothetical protein
MSGCGHQKWSINTHGSENFGSEEGILCICAAMQQPHLAVSYKYRRLKQADGPIPAVFLIAQNGK